MYYSKYFLLKEVDKVYPYTRIDNAKSTSNISLSVTSTDASPFGARTIVPNKDKFDASASDVLYRGESYTLTANLGALTTQTGEKGRLWALKIGHGQSCYSTSGGSSIDSISTGSFTYKGVVPNDDTHRLIWDFEQMPYYQIESAYTSFTVSLSSGEDISSIGANYYLRDSKVRFTGKCEISSDYYSMIDNVPKTSMRMSVNDSGSLEYCLEEKILTLSNENGKYYAYVDFVCDVAKIVNFGGSSSSKNKGIFTLYIDYDKVYQLIYPKNIGLAPYYYYKNYDGDYVTQEVKSGNYIGGGRGVVFEANSDYLSYRNTWHERTSSPGFSFKVTGVSADCYDDSYWWELTSETESIQMNDYVVNKEGGYKILLHPNIKYSLTGFNGGSENPYTHVGSGAGAAPGPYSNLRSSGYDSIATNVYESVVETMYSFSGVRGGGISIGNISYTNDSTSTSASNVGSFTIYEGRYWDFWPYEETYLESGDVELQSTQAYINSSYKTSLKWGASFNVDSGILDITFKDRAVCTYSSSKYNYVWIKSWQLEDGGSSGYLSITHDVEYWNS